MAFVSASTDPDDPDMILDLPSSDGRRWRNVLRIARVTRLAACIRDATASLRNTSRNNAGVLRVLRGTQGYSIRAPKALTCTFISPLQGEGRGFEPLERPPC